MPVQTRLHEIRNARGISVAHLAKRVGVTRQTIYAIEEGSFVPNTAVSLQLARTLEVTVEEIFSIDAEDALGPIHTELLPGGHVDEGQLVRVCLVNKRNIAVPMSYLPAYLPAADGSVRSRTKDTASVHAPSRLSEGGKRLLIAGCDPALSLLQEALRGSGMEVVSAPCSSRRALDWLKQGRVHAAGSHLLDPPTGDYNVPIVCRLLPRASVRMVTFAMWELGLVVQKRNPKGVRSLADLVNPKVTLINREKGSGSRDLLDSGLREFGIDKKLVAGYTAIAPGHLAAAYAVAVGSVDCCIAPQSAARCFGLDFVPLTVQRFDLTLAKRTLELPAAKALFDLLNRSAFRKKLQCIAGYDTSKTGAVLM